MRQTPSATSTHAAQFRTPRQVGWRSQRAAARRTSCLVERVTRRTAALALLAACGAAQAQDVTASWFNTNGAPVSGAFSNPVNWSSGGVPTGSLSFTNELNFNFANPADFTATNDITSGLNVSTIRSTSPGTYTATIAGLPLFAQATRIFGGPDNRIVIEAPFQGGSVAIQSGTVAFEPSSGSQNNFSGGLFIRGGVFEGNRGTDFGSLSNTVVVENGTLRATNTFNIAIPVNTSRSNGDNSTIDVIAGETLGLLQPVGQAGFFLRVPLTKTGPGTLDLRGANSSETFDWRLLGGTTIATTNALGDDSEVFFDNDAVLRLAGTNTVKDMDAVRGGVVDLNSNTFIIDGAPEIVSLTIFGPRFDGAGTVIHRRRGYILQCTSAPDFAGEIRLEDGDMRINANSSPAPTARIFVGANSDIFTDGPGGVVGNLTGPGRVTISGNFAQPGSLAFGADNSSGTWTNQIIGQNPDARFIKDGSGSYTLDANLSQFQGVVAVREGQLFIPRARYGGVREVHIETNAIFSPAGTDSIPPVTGAGTLSIPGNFAVVTIGEGDESFTFAGTFAGSGSSNLRKRGTGEWTITTDNSGFPGLLDILGGSVRITGNDFMPSAFLFVNGQSTLNGHGSLTSANPVLNQGEINADVPGETLRIAGTISPNLGTLTAANAGILQIDSGQIIQDNTPAGAIVADAATVAFSAPPGSTTPPLVQGGSITSTNQGEVVFDASTAIVRNASVAADLAFINAGVLELDASAVELTATSTVRLRAGEPALTPSIVGAGSIALDGTLRVELQPGVTPAEGDRYRLLDLAASPALVVSGAFAAIDAPDIAPLAFAIEQTADALDVVVVAPCAPDLAAPVGVLDVFDVIEYLARFDAADPTADLAAPSGTFDFFDLIEFLNLFSAGC
ncbi:MAG: GC-type dockerin domain-anchored protein [Planctomycetota bacterium]